MLSCLCFESINRTLAFSCRPCFGRLVGCIAGRLSISQLKNCSQDSFPAGLRSSVVPLHPEELRSTHACQTEYTLIAPDWEQQIFLELLDITEANKHCKAMLLSQINRKSWDGLLSAALIIFCGFRKWQSGHLLRAYLSLWLSVCYSVNPFPRRHFFPKLQSHVINNWETGSTWNPSQERHLKLIKGPGTSWTQSHLKSEIKRLITDKQKSKFIVWEPKAAALGDLLLLPAKQPFSHCLHELPRSQNSLL